jgi:hypothetical protein
MFSIMENTGEKWNRVFPTDLKESLKGDTMGN